VNLTVLAASGATGHELTRQGLDRGHTVTAIARDPARIRVPDAPNLTRLAADVRDPEAMARALANAGTVLSGLGLSQGDQPGVLATGARAVLAAQPGHVIWLGAFGTGASAPAAGALTRTLLRTFMRSELGDKLAADSAVLAAGGTVFHAGPMSGAPLSPARRTAELDGAPRRLFPARVSRATVAAAMLDEAEHPEHPGQILIPLDR
jgi:uncharacterized protein YbjT (DUF2867 family)